MSNSAADIFQAIFANDVHSLRSLMDSVAANPDAVRNREGKTPLMAAASQPPSASSAPTIDLLLSYPAVNINLTDHDGESALYQAAALGNSPALEALIRGGASVELENAAGVSPLMIAAFNGFPDACRTLVQLGNAAIDRTDQTGRTALLFAAYESKSLALRVLLGLGANANAVDESGWSCLMLAAYAGNVEDARALLEAGADVYLTSAEGKTARIIAVESGYDDVEKVIQSHLIINAKRPEGGGGIPQNTRYPLAPSTTISFPPHDSTGRRTADTDSSHPLILPSSSHSGSTTVTGTNTSVDPYGTQVKMICRNPSNRRTSIMRKPSRKSGGTATPHPPLPALGTGIAAAGSLSLSGGIPGGTRLRQQGEALSGAPPLPGTTPPPGIWERFAQILTAPILPVALTRFGGMSDPHIQQAWREKVALCVIIAVISAIFGFFTFGLSIALCHPLPSLTLTELATDHGSAAPVAERFMAVRGEVFQLGGFFDRGEHRPLSAAFSDASLAPTINPLFGHDISPLFPVNRAQSACTLWPATGSCDYTGTAFAGRSAEPALHCHISSASDSLLSAYSISRVSYLWDEVRASSSLFVYDSGVYDIGSYLSANLTHLGDPSITTLLRNMVGQDATRKVAVSPTLQALVPCLDAQFRVGNVDGTTIGCVTTNAIVGIAMALLAGITLIKFTSAVVFDWFLSRKLGKISSKPRDPATRSHILLLVTAYSEDEAGLRTTFDSMALTDYPEDHKLLFVIADGDVTGAGNPKSTPELCLDLMERLPQSKSSGYSGGEKGSPDDDDDEEGIPLSYNAVGEGEKAHNMARLYTGYYLGPDGHRIPYLLIWKCGTEQERAGGPKAGNRGKRDSQLILMRWLSRVCFNERLAPLEYALFERSLRLCGVTPDRYDMVLMVDADTLVKPDSVKYMVAAMERDPLVMGLCGETRIANKRQSWVTMIQVYEYYISHHLGKAFESIFGGVTCLPGCFCMYRIKSPKQDGYSVPVLANPDIVEMYSSSDVSTLHRKNLLLLGEDRFLTTLMLRAFPKRKMIYVPKAVCRTIVPDEFSVLLSQRRRWINSTIHNLLELILVPQLCGIFCCSMQFVIFLELTGTVVLPAALLFLVYLIISACFGVNVTLPLVFMAGVFLLQAILILCTTRKPIYVLWMLVYILAMPIWNLVLPAYAFWHFDDFSWGATRQTDGPDTGHGHGDGGGGKGDGGAGVIPQKRWHEWKKQERRVARRRDSRQRTKHALGESISRGKSEEIRRSANLHPSELTSGIVSESEVSIPHSRGTAPLPPLPATSEEEAVFTQHSAFAPSGPTNAFSTLPHGQGGGGAWGPQGRQ